MSQQAKDYLRAIPIVVVGLGLTFYILTILLSL